MFAHERTSLTLLALAFFHAPAVRSSRSSVGSQDDDLEPIGCISANVSESVGVSCNTSALVTEDPRPQAAYPHVAATLVPASPVYLEVDHLVADNVHQLRVEMKARGHHRWHHEEQSLLQKMSEWKPEIQEAVHDWQSQTDPPPAQLMHVVARGLGIAEGEMCSFTPLPATYMGCANGCLCDWGQRCYAKYFELGSLTTDGGEIQHDNVQINIGECQLAPWSLVLISFTIFLTCLSSVVLFRMYLQWREFKALQLMHQSQQIQAGRMQVRVKGLTQQQPRKSSLKKSAAAKLDPSTEPSNQAEQPSSSSREAEQLSSSQEADPGKADFDKADPDKRYDGRGAFTWEEFLEHYGDKAQEKWDAAATQCSTGGSEPASHEEQAATSSCTTADSGSQQADQVSRHEEPSATSPCITADSGRQQADPVSMHEEPSATSSGTIADSGSQQTVLLEEPRDEHGEEPTIAGVEAATESSGTGEAELEKSDSADQNSNVTDSRKADEGKAPRSSRRVSFSDEQVQASMPKEDEEDEQESY